MGNQKITRSIRADADTIERFTALAGSFPSQGDALESLVSVYEIDAAKSAAVDMKDDIKAFSSHVTAINKKFVDTIGKYLVMKDDCEAAEKKIAELEKKLSLYESVKNEKELADREEQENAVKFMSIGEIYAKNRDLVTETEKLKKENNDLLDKLNESKKINAELHSEISQLRAELKIKEQQHHFELVKAVNESASGYLERISKLMEDKDRLTEQLLNRKLD